MLWASVRSDELNISTQTWKDRLAELLVGEAGVVILVPADATSNGQHVIVWLSLVTYIHTMAWTPYP
ncbi:hypothetical protein AQI94_02240 [Streptomyces pseudovenezuelae]|uniref:Uncharacterized protein n=1 Tax=Streptomyces pseudovenezuelae TaxID=67350 RepID=A0A101NCF6_9ACTN|nr:hypothetical protein AQI94_02240 [Streptomyces pseudovenezuelae]